MNGRLDLWNSALCPKLGLEDPLQAQRARGANCRATGHLALKRALEEDGLGRPSSGQQARVGAQPWERMDHREDSGVAGAKTACL